MITVRNVQTADAPRLLEIYARYVTDTAVTFETAVPSLEEFAGRIRRVTEKYPWLVVERDGAVEGYACAGPFKDRAAYDWAAETTVYLDHRATGGGLGRLVYEALEKALKAMGILNLYACIAYPEEEDAYLTKNSADFHAHLGYRLAGTFRQCGFKFGRWYDMVWMEKILGPHPADQKPVIPWKDCDAGIDIVAENQPLPHR